MNIFKSTINRWLPHSHIEPDDPFFAYEARVLSWGKNPQDLTRLAYKTWSIAILIGIAITLMTAPLLNQEAASYFSIILLGISQLDLLFLDFPASQAALHSIHDDMKSNRWEAVVVTGVKLKALIHAKYTVIQISLWRALIYSVALRIIFVIWMTIPTLDTLREFYSIASSLDRTLVLLTTPLLFLAGILYCIIPVYRLRTLAAIGLNESMSTEYPVIDGISVILKVWSTPVFVIFIMLCSGIMIVMFRFVYLVPLNLFLTMFIASGLYDHEAKINLDEAIVKIKKLDLLEE